MVEGPVVVEAALNGITSRSRNPRVPISPEEQAADALACIDAGATVVHTHCADMFVPAEEAAAQYLAAYLPVVEARPGAVLYPTIGLGETVEQRYGHVPILAAAGAIRASFLDPGSVNLGGTGPDGLPPASDYVYRNTFADIAYATDLADRLHLGPSVAVFEPGFLRVVLAYHAAGRLPAGTLVKLYFSAGGYVGDGAPLWGAPPVAEALELYLAMLGDAPIPWAVAVLGGSVFDTPIAQLALERGGHLRVGIEDDAAGPANVQQVEAAAALCTQVGRPVASITDTEAILGLPVAH